MRDGHIFALQLRADDRVPLWGPLWKQGGGDFSSEIAAMAKAEARKIERICMESSLDICGSNNLLHPTFSVKIEFSLGCTDTRKNYNDSNTDACTFIMQTCNAVSFKFIVNFISRTVHYMYLGCLGIVDTVNI